MSPEPSYEAHDRFDLEEEERRLPLAGPVGRLFEREVDGSSFHHLERPTEFLLDLRTYPDRVRGATRR